VRYSRFAVATACWLIVNLVGASAAAQFQPPSERLIVRTDRALSWTDGRTVVLQVEGPVAIETDRATLSARAAVIWITPSRGRVLDEQTIEIALIGSAVLRQPTEQLLRTGDRLFVTTQVRGNVRVVSEERLTRNASHTALYQQAARMRPLGGPAIDATAEPGNGLLLQRRWIDAMPGTLGPPGTANQTGGAPPTTAPVRPRQPVTSRAAHVETIQTADDRVAFVLSRGVTVQQRRGSGELIELQADRAVLFTTLRNLREAGEGKRFETPEDAVEAAYLEGDVRIVYTPARAREPEQRLAAERVYYEFTTDRAVLTHAVLHTLDPERQIPIVVRAETVRQLSVGEYHAEKVKLSTSQFLTPTYSVNADRAYVRQLDTGDPRFGTLTSFRANDSTADLFGVPFFWLPYTSGSVTERGAALRNVILESGSRFGFGVRSEWGLFESLGVLPPADLDVSYNLDYFEKRGPATGAKVDYRGGYITETTKEAWDFIGRVDSYIIKDHGDDRFGSERAVIEPEDEIRQRVLWEHQHFFPGDWQLQLRGGYSSDPTFLEEFFEREFDTGLPHDASVYLKRQRDSEAFTLLLQYPTNDFVTTANEVQEQVQVERLPEMGYRRIGDSFGQDQLTFFSDNTFSSLRFHESEASLAEQGYRAGQSPGIPSFGTTGTDDQRVLRGDFRQQIDYPLTFGQFKLVPYVLGRYTAYTNAPDDNFRDRFFVGTGVRVRTAFWKVDDAARSSLWDINRLRHVIEPELNVFTSAQTHDRNSLFIYDEPIDAINDVTAFQVGLRQRWQTKRGGAGRFRSVDFFTLNVEGDFFLNQPDDDTLAPTGFRGLFFPSLPEASVPRNAVNADAAWRVSDTTAVLSDVQYNLDELQLATTALGVAVHREPRTSYFTGVRYIGQVNSTIATIAANYELSAKYALSFTQAFNLGDRRNENSSVTVIRRFDKLLLTLTLYYDAVDDESGFRFGIIPEGLGAGLSSETLGSVFGQP
jgi:hypothetical protein